MLVPFQASRFDVWRRRSTTPMDARPSCRVFFYVVTAALPIMPAQRRAGTSSHRHKASGDAMIAAIFLHRKALRFVLSRRNAENHSCFRVGKAVPFVLSSRNACSRFVLSSRNGPAPFVLSSRNAHRHPNHLAVGKTRQAQGSSPGTPAVARSGRAGGRCVMTTRAVAGLRPALRSSPCAGGGAGASSIRRM